MLALFVFAIATICLLCWSCGIANSVACNLPSYLVAPSLVQGVLPLWIAISLPSSQSIVCILANSLWSRSGAPPMSAAPQFCFPTQPSGLSWTSCCATFVLLPPSFSLLSSLRCHNCQVTPGSNQVAWSTQWFLWLGTRIVVSSVCKY